MYVKTRLLQTPELNYRPRSAGAILYDGLTPAVNLSSPNSWDTGTSFSLILRKYRTHVSVTWHMQKRIYIYTVGQIK